MERFFLDDGRTLAWRCLGQGPPLVLLHGWAMSSAVFAEVAPMLAQDHQVLLVDLPGHGASEPVARYTLSGLVADVGTWMEAVVGKRCAVLGWSLGGQVAMQLAATRDTLLSHLLLVASTPRFVAGHDWHGGLPEGQVKIMGRQLQRAYEPTMSDFFARMFEGEALTRERYRQLISIAVRGRPLPAAVEVLGCLEILRQVDLRPLLPSLLLPTLVHYGDRDVITPPTAGDALTAAIPAAHGERWSGVGHAPFLSRPAQSVALWREFLS